MKAQPAAPFIQSHNPTKIGVVGGHAFYEHPTKGDEAPLLIVIDGVIEESEFWELDDAQDALNEQLN